MQQTKEKSFFGQVKRKILREDVVTVQKGKRIPYDSGKFKPTAENVADTVRTLQHSENHLERLARNHPGVVLQPVYAVVERDGFGVLSDTLTPECFEVSPDNLIILGGYDEIWQEKIKEAIKNSEMFRNPLEDQLAITYWKCLRNNLMCSMPSDLTKKVSAKHSPALVEAVQLETARASGDKKLQEEINGSDSNLLETAKTAAKKTCLVDIFDISRGRGSFARQKKEHGIQIYNPLETSPHYKGDNLEGKFISDFLKENFPEMEIKDDLNNTAEAILATFENAKSENLPIPIFLVKDESRNMDYTIKLGRLVRKKYAQRAKDKEERKERASHVKIGQVILKKEEYVREIQRKAYKPVDYRKAAARFLLLPAVVAASAFAGYHLRGNIPTIPTRAAAPTAPINIEEPAEPAQEQVYTEEKANLSPGGSISSEYNSKHDQLILTIKAQDSRDIKSVRIFQCTSDGKFLRNVIPKRLGGERRFDGRNDTSVKFNQYIDVRNLPKGNYYHRCEITNSNNKKALTNIDKFIVE